MLLPADERMDRVRRRLRNAQHVHGGIKLHASATNQRHVPHSRRDLLRAGPDAQADDSRADARANRAADAVANTGADANADAEELRIWLNGSFRGVQRGERV